ncbi:uncharacterized protein KLLA0_F17545g [Kluyveromyces lactis]|uniref:KLLA0F17545p n=1 Tax=Kluyveromyces lactis (strain ATCC 8585 / CBS 2359 / DSM 70799 / NBRC 1267 / NRRL Y-1140 / WM37) TaxID=284590 RepID=Q6CJM1_KLULA|nr:uncharacterized protein KLLA0_F17545g [Kluyveromyces lactis]CAG98576.1 KLLA0F17545p [Kluyveromyces lactis]|eukprot:XP_455868.1 uncharacterized protein KLLA0_F17545g [Kluyveromyces lactis]
MDAGVTALDQRRGAGMSSKAQLRNQLLHSDIGNIDITKEQQINKQKGNTGPMAPPVVPLQAQQYESNYNPSSYNYMQQPRQQSLQMQPRPHFDYPGDSSRKSSMSSSTASFSNFFKGKYKKLNQKRHSQYDEKANEDDDNTDFSDHDSSFLTFNDISSMRNNGGHAYGYGGHLDDTSPIIPTIVTSGNTNSMNNIEYRKLMMNQKKMAFNSLAKQQQQQAQFSASVPGGPRTMSLQNYHQRPMVRPGVSGPGTMMGPAGPQQSRIPRPPNGSRFNSLMGGGASPMAGRPGYPPQQGPPNDPRTMSLTADRRPPTQMNGNSQFRNGYQGPYAASPTGSRNMGFPGQVNGPVPARGPPVTGSSQYGPNSGPRAMSLQTQSYPQPFYQPKQNVSQDNVFNERQATSSLAPPPQPQQLVNKAASGSSSSYASVNSVISGRVSEQSSPTTPSNASFDEQNQIPSLPRSPVKYQLHATLSNDNEDFEKDKALPSFNEEEEDQQTYSGNKDHSHSDEQYDSDSLVKLNILTLSEPARQVLQIEEEKTEKEYDLVDSSETKSNQQDSLNDDINLRPSTALIQNIPVDLSPILNPEISDNSSSRNFGDNVNRTESIVSKAHAAVDSGNSNTNEVLQSKHDSYIACSGEKGLKKSGSSFQKAKNFLMKIKRTKSGDQRPLTTVPSSARSSRSSMAVDEGSEIQLNDTFRAKSGASSDKRRISYHSLFSASSAGNHHDQYSNKEKTFDRSTLQIRKSMIIGESTEIQEVPCLEKEYVKQKAEPISALPYKPSFASEKDPKQPLLITEEYLNILKQNMMLMQELQLVSTELAESIAREGRLESELESKNPKEPESPQALSLLDFETELRKKSSKIVELIQNLNEERLKRFIAEEQNLLYQHGIKPSPNELALQINELKTQLQSKDLLIEQLQKQVHDS